MPVNDTTPGVGVNLHGLTLTFQTDASELHARFLEIYGHLPAAPDAPPDILVQWELSSKALAPLPPPLSPLAESEVVSHYGDEQQFVVRMPKYALLAIDLEQWQITGVVTQNCLTVYGAFEDVLMMALAPLYRRLGWFPLHAFAAVPPGGPAALICGAMGSGKTTTGLALLEAGWKLLSNDSPLLRLNAGEVVEVLAYPGRLSAFDDSLARFERLAQFIPPAVGESSGPRVKRIFRAEEAFSEPWAEQAVAGGVFFPRIIPGAAGISLVKVPSSAAVVQLMPQAIEGWDKATIAPHLHLLSRLAEQARCFELQLSPAVDQIPGVLAAALPPLDK